MNTYLDILPVELFDEIFIYFTCNDILKSFYGISDYINQIIFQYKTYLLDITLENLTKTQFDLIYSFIDVNKIIKLKIGSDQYNLSNQYLSKTNEEQTLSNLRSFWMNKTCQSKHFNLNSIDFNKLISFRFDSIDSISQVDMNCLFENLQYLVGCSSNYFRQIFTNIPNHLIFLHMFFDSFDHIHSFINPNVNQLKSLGIGVELGYTSSHSLGSLFNSYQWENLIQLNLNLQGSIWVNFQVFEQMLSSMSKLKYLTLILTEQVSSSNDILDGNQWRLFLSMKLIDLKKFNFKFPINVESDDDIINCLYSFRTFWWLEKKQWFIEYSYEECTLLTVPNFSSKIFQNTNLEVINWILNQKMYYLNISHLEFNSDDLNLNLFCTNENQPCFFNVNSLSLNGDLTDENLHILLNNIDQNKIQHIQIISKSTNLENFGHLLNHHLTNLSSLDLQCQHIDNLFRLITYPLYTIRYLIIFSYKINNIKRFFSDLYNLFPYLNYLKTEYFSKENLRYLLDNFIYLDELSLRLKQGETIPEHQWIEKNTRLKNCSFQIGTIQANKDSNEKIFTIWINNLDKVFK